MAPSIAVQDMRSSVSEPEADPRRLTSTSLLQAGRLNARHPTVWSSSWPYHVVRAPSNSSECFYEALGSFHWAHDGTPRWLSARVNTPTDEYAVRQRSLPSSIDLLRAGALLPPGPTLLLGESNDAFIVEDTCTACGLSTSPWVDLPQLSAGKKTTATFFGCNCSGWVVAFANHYGLSRSPPYHYEIDRPRLSWGRHPANPFHIPSVPVDFTARLPFLAHHFRSYWGAPPATVIAHSASWDSARACKLGANYSVRAYVQQWRRNASDFIQSLRTAFPASELLWRTGNRLGNQTSTWLFCPDMWRYHNAVLYEPIPLMEVQGVSVLRWDRFVDQAVHAVHGSVYEMHQMHQIHPPRAMHLSWSRDVLLPLLSRATCAGTEVKPHGVPHLPTN